MEPIGTWMGRKIDSGIAAIEGGRPDYSFGIPPWRRSQLRQAAAPALAEIVLDTEGRGYALRGGVDLAQARRVFVLPLEESGRV